MDEPVSVTNIKMTDPDADHSDYKRAPVEQFEVEEPNNGAPDVTFDSNTNDDVRPRKSRLDLDRLRTWEYWKDLLIASTAELIATTIFLYFAILTGQIGDKYAAAFGTGVTVFVLISTFGTISGAPINPAVAVGFFIVGEISLIRMGFFIVVECLGAIFGGLIARAILSHSIVEIPGQGNITQFELINGAAHFLNGGITPGLAILAEIFYTFILLAVVLNAAVDTKSGTPMGPLAIGFMVTAGILSGWENTSGSFNPVRSLGSAVAISYYRPDVWDHHYVYWVGPIIGGCLASLVYRCLFADEKHSIRTNVIKLI